jgi:hypothetical protein
MRVGRFSDLQKTEQTNHRWGIGVGTLVWSCQLTCNKHPLMATIKDIITKNTGGMKRVTCNNQNLTFWDFQLRKQALWILLFNMNLVIQQPKLSIHIWRQEDEKPKLRADSTMGNRQTLGLLLGSLLAARPTEELSALFASSKALASYITTTVQSIACPAHLRRTNGETGISSCSTSSLPHVFRNDAMDKLYWEPLKFCTQQFQILG